MDLDSVIAVLIGSCAILYGLHRFCCLLEDAGYVYYRKPKEGGAGLSGTLFELDKLTRPSSEYVQAAQNEIVEHRTESGEGDNNLPIFKWSKSRSDEIQ